MGNNIDMMTSTKSNKIIKVNKYVSIGASDSVGFGTSNPCEDGWIPQFT